MAMDIATRSNYDASAERKQAEKAREAAKVREEAAAKQEENRKLIIEEQMKAATLDETQGKIISESDDGDTVRASKESIAALNDGMVIAKGNDESSEAQDAVKEENIMNLTGYSSSQIETLYRQGKITSQERNKELDRREELKEITGQIDAKEEAESKEVEKETETKKVTNDINSEKVSAAETLKEEDEKRAETVKEKAAADNATAQRDKNIEESSEALSAFSNDMNRIIDVQNKLENDPNLERFASSEKFSFSITE